MPGGEYTIGSNDSYPEEKPVRKVYVRAFRIDPTEVTVQQFKIFVQEAGYKTLAEKQPTKEEYPDAILALLKPGSAVFTPHSDRPPEECWSYQPGASWRDGKPNEPVVHVAYEDAMTYARWAGKDLPTEEEWEAAAAANGSLYPWGNEETPGGKWQSNVWQGPFPEKDTGEDGFRGLAPVKSFKPNRFGLYDIAGNAWEWTKTDGPDPKTKLTKGGSYLCARSYCHRYRPTAKQDVTVDTSTCHIGFRCVIRLEKNDSHPRSASMSEAASDFWVDWY